MTDDVPVTGIIEAGRLRQFAETYASRPAGVDNPLVSEAKIHFDEDGVSVTVVDPANVCMIGPSSLDKRAFESYDAPGRVTVGVNLVRLLDLIKPAAADDLVRFDVNMETRHVEIEYGATELSMALIDPEAIRNEPDLPDLDLPNTARVTADELGQAIDVADMMSDHLRVQGDVDAGEVVFSARGDTDEGTVRYAVDGITEDAMSILSLSYCRMIAKPIPGDAEVRVEFGNEFPVRLVWSGIEGHFDVTGTIAPRIQSE